VILRPLRFVHPVLQRTQTELGADFIVYWKPFHYFAEVYIDIGIDVAIHFLGTHDIGLDAGADLEVWAPPSAGTPICPSK
jgi:hypothetical protein